MMSQQTQLVVRKRRKRNFKRGKNRKFKIRVRYQYHYYRWIRTEDYGTFRDLYEKYKGGDFTFWCGDLPPKQSTDGSWTGYRLDGDKTHTSSTMKRYGRHKAWIDPLYKFEGKKVILVYNAREAIEPLLL